MRVCFVASMDFDSKRSEMAEVGHASRHPQMAQALIAATDFFATPAANPIHPETRDEQHQAAP